jgi:hypothetical protein
MTGTGSDQRDHRINGVFPLDAVTAGHHHDLKLPTLAMRRSEFVVVIAEHTFGDSYAKRVRTWSMVDRDELRTSSRVVIDAPADKLYEMVSDISRMGEWSPACVGGAWDEGASPTPGGWFTGRNSRNGQEYETRCEVTVAEPGRDFTFVVGGGESGWARWGYRFTPTGEGSTDVEEHWEMVGQHPAMKDFSDEQFIALRDANKANIEATLAKLKLVAEGLS